MVQPHKMVHNILQIISVSGSGSFLEFFPWAVLTTKYQHLVIKLSMAMTNK